MDLMGATVSMWLELPLGPAEPRNGTPQCILNKVTVCVYQISSGSRAGKQGTHMSLRAFLKQTAVNLCRSLLRVHYLCILSSFRKSKRTRLFCTALVGVIIVVLVYLCSSYPSAFPFGDQDRTCEQLGAWQQLEELVSIS